LQFGAHKLWVDCKEQVIQAEIWLEMRTADVEARLLAGRGVARCDAIEPLPGGLDHLVAADGGWPGPAGKCLR
jgi:hypothetical protein